MKEQVGEFERHIVFGAAYDKRDSDPAKNYGIHGVDMCFVLKGSEGAVQFVLYTGWQLPSLGNRFTEPMPTDLGYHSLVPHHEDQGVISESCEWVDGKPCYYDGSTLNARPVFDILVSEGEDGLWRELEEYYGKVFGERAAYD